MRVVIFIAVIALFVTCVSANPSHAQFDEIEKGVAHVKATIKGLGPMKHKDTPERRRIDVLKGPAYHESDYHHEIQATVDREVDTTARAIIDNPIRQAAKAAEAASIKFTKTVTSGTATLLAHNKQEAARKAANTRKPKAAAAPAASFVERAGRINKAKAAAAAKKHHAKKHAKAHKKAAAAKKHAKASKKHAKKHAKKAAAKKPRKLATHELHALNNGLDNISIQKIAKLTAPKIEYYHAVQKIGDREADLAARAVIDTPERAAYRQQKADDLIFTKTVSSASSLLKEHNAFERHPAEAKTF